MMIYVVSKVVDQIDDPSTTVVSAHVDKGHADAAAKAINPPARPGLIHWTYGVVEQVELDLSGALTQDTIDALREVAG